VDGSIRDILALVGAVAGVGVVLLLPSVSLAWLARLFGARRLRSAVLYPVALIVGYAVLPVADSLAARWLGLDGALAINLALAGHGAWVIAAKGFPWPSRRTLVACAIGVATLIAVSVDIDIGGRLYPSLLMVDTVKHGAVISAITQTGTVPPFDPFFLREQPSGYYYYYYVVSALTQRLSFGLIDARAAMFGQVFWTTLALIGTMLMVWRRSRLGRASTPVLLAFAAAAGLQVLTVVASLASFRGPRAQINWWGEEVNAFVTSLVWVPHHLAGLIATWAALLALTPIAERGRPDRRHDTAAILVAAAALASVVGLSTWVAFGAAATFGLWLISLATRGHWRAVRAVVLAGLLALALALPDLIDVMRNRAYAGPPVEFSVRSFPLADVLTEPGWGRMLLRLLMLPLQYFYTFGVFMVGALLYWNGQRAGHVPAGRERPRNETTHLLVLSAVAGLVLASFLRSVILNNDLGWRVILFTQFAVLMWTVAALGSNAPTISSTLRRARAGVAAALVLGWAGVAYDIVALRAAYLLGLGDPEQQATPDPAIEHDRRAAYEWLNRHVPSGKVTQHNPDVPRAFAYGLYGHHRVAVADRHNSFLLGADRHAVDARLAELIPVFAASLPAAEVRRRLAANKVDIAVVAADDPVWREPSSWVWQAEPLRAWPHVRLVVITGAVP
jgi:hypothetical protein